jgi:hypothetical protein
LLQAPPIPDFVFGSGISLSTLLSDLWLPPPGVAGVEAVSKAPGWSAMERYAWVVLFSVADEILKVYFWKKKRAGQEDVKEQVPQLILLCSFFEELLFSFCELVIALCLDYSSATTNLQHVRKLGDHTLAVILYVQNVFQDGI